MPPTLRSTPNTPAKATNGGSNTPRTTPRKIPHCTKCKRPRAGHPRQGCPFADTQNPTGQEPELADALEELHIKERVSENENDLPQARRRRASAQVALQVVSLASLSTNSSEIVNNILQPGIMDDDSDVDADERRKNILQWQEDADNKLSVRSVMPGTLATPTSSFWKSQSVVREPPCTKTLETTLLPAPEPEPLPDPKLLMRSMSMEERDAFLDGLKETSKAPPAMVYVLSLSDISSILHSATKHGFHCRTLEGSEKDTARLILGRDERAVMELHNGMKGQIKQQGRTALHAAAGGAVVGAVATWTGLAFA